MEVLNWIRNQWDRSVGLAGFIAGAIVLMLGYWGVSGTRDSAEQVAYVVSGGIAGLFLLGLGATFWLSADLRDEWRKLHEISSDLKR
jgi:hypothetical protein